MVINFVSFYERNSKKNVLCWSLWKNVRSFHTSLINFVLSNFSSKLWLSTIIIEFDIIVKYVVVCYLRLLPCHNFYEIDLRTSLPSKRTGIIKKIVDHPNGKCLAKCTILNIIFFEAIKSFSWQGIFSKALFLIL